MTIDKKLSVLTVTLITILAVLLLLGSCSKTDNSQVLEQLEALRDTQAQEKADDGYSRYRIVVPENCSGQIWEAAERISTCVAEATGKECSIVKDCETVSEESEIGEILLGYTNRESSRELLTVLSRDDYICTAVGASVVLGGKSEGATLEAAERFLSENTVTENGILTVSNGFEYYCEYEYDGATLWNNRLGSMTVVCSSENIGLARLFVESVADRCGDYPRLVYCNGETDGSRELLLTLDSSAVGLSKIIYDGEDVYIVSDTEYGLSVAAFGLMERLFDDGGETAEVSGDREISFVYETPRISVGYMEADVPQGREMAYIVSIARYINNAGNDVTVISAVDETLASELEGMVGGTYSLHYIRSDNGALAVAVYKTDCFSVKTASLTVGDGCNALELVLEDKENGRLYGVMEFFVTDINEPAWKDTVSQSLAASTGISFALLHTAQPSSDFCVPQGTLTEYSAESPMGSGVGRLLGLVSANGNARGQVTVDGDGENITVTVSDIRAVWCDGFFELASENNSEG